MASTDALTVHPQTELGLNIYVAVSNICDGVTNTHAVVSKVQQDVANTHAIVSDISRKVLGSPEGDDDQQRLVSDTRIQTVPVLKCMLTIAQTRTRSATPTPNCSTISYLHLAHLVNHLHRHRGFVSDVTS